MVRKISASPTVTSPFTYGIGTLNREATVAIIISSKRKCQSSCCRVSRGRERSIVPAPAATMKTKKGLKRRCLFIALISDYRRLPQVKGVVVLTEFVARFSVTSLRCSIGLVNQQANRLGALQQMIRQLGHAPCAIAISPMLCADIHAFEVNNIWRIADDVCFKLQASIFDGYPNSSLFDPARATFAEARRIHVQRVYTAFVESRLRMNRHYQLKLLRSRCPQRLHRNDILRRAFIHQ